MIAAGAIGGVGRVSILSQAVARTGIQTKSPGVSVRWGHCRRWASRCWMGTRCIGGGVLKMSMDTSATGIRSAASPIVPVASVATGRQAFRLGRAVAVSASQRLLSARCGAIPSLSLTPRQLVRGGDSVNGGTIEGGVCNLTTLFIFFRFSTSSSLATDAFGMRVGILCDDMSESNSHRR